MLTPSARFRNVCVSGCRGSDLQPCAALIPALRVARVYPAMALSKRIPQREPPGAPILFLERRENLVIEVLRPFDTVPRTFLIFERKKPRIARIQHDPDISLNI